MKRKHLGIFLCVIAVVGVLFTVALQKKDSKSEIFSFVRENQTHLSQFVCDTMEAGYGSYEKPTDIYVLRARAALTDFSKRHRALRDLERLIELDPANRALYQAEIRRWGSQERAWEKQAEAGQRYPAACRGDAGGVGRHSEGKQAATVGETPALCKRLL